MTTKTAKKKQEQRQRAKDGRLILQVEIFDREGWLDMLEGAQHFAGPGRDHHDIVAASERYIAWMVRRYRQAEAEQRLGLRGSAFSPIEGYGYGYEDDDEGDNGVDETSLDDLDRQ